MAEDEPTAVAGPHAQKIAHEDTQAASISVNLIGEERVLPRGCPVGRYLVLDRIGTGGMGVVYAAYDPELDRRIAIKVLRAGKGEPSSTAGRARLLREAQALARLSHPNVIAVHDVGAFEDGIFLAMDLVDGATLSGWQRAETRSWRELRDVYLQAGLGLVAAHRSGLVHRDFKPENVLVARDGSVHVTDFGLALVTGETDDLESHESGESAPDELAPKHTNLVTKAGTVLGTPPYMSPEQHAGRRTDARSDQFSFCVALYDALYNEHPYSSGTISELRAALLVGQVRPAPAGTRVPAWMRRALLRGLAVNPDERYASLADLLAELGRDPSARGRRMFSIGGAVLAGGALAAIAIGVTSHRRGAAEEACSAAAEPLSEVWNDGVRARLAGAFDASGAPYAKTAWLAAERSLAHWADGWRVAQLDACRRTRVLHVQSADLLDRRTACLDDRLDELRQLTAVFAHADPVTVEHAVAAAAALPALDDCEDTHVLLSRARAPTDPAVTARIADVRARLSKGDSLHTAGRFQDALALAASAADDAAAIGYPPLLADALYERGRFQGTLGQDQAAEASLVQAAEAALAGGDDALVADAWIKLVKVVGPDLTHYNEADRWARMASALVLRAFRGEDREVSLHEQLGLLAKDEGKIAVARAELDAALDLASKLWGDEDPKTIDHMYDVANVAVEQGKYDEADKLFARVLERATRRYGADHPKLAQVWSGIGSLAYARGNYKDSLTAHQKQLDLNIAAYGPDHPSVQASWVNVGIDHEALTHYDDALAAYEHALGIATHRDRDGIDVAYVLASMGGTYHQLARFQQALDANLQAIEIFRRVLGPEHWQLGQTESNIGVELKSLGRFQEAYEAYQRAGVILEKGFGPEHTSVGGLLDNEGEVLRLLGRPAEAARAYQRALQIFEKAVGPDHPAVADILTGLGRSQIALGHADVALPLLERALAMREKDPGDVANLAETRFATAQALFVLAKDRPGALKLAHEARDAYASEGNARKRELGDVDAFLKTM